MDEEKLTQAAARAAELLSDALPRPEDCVHEFSPRFRRRMQRLMFRQKHPVLMRGLQSAAVLFLTITVLFGSLLTVSTDAREFVSGWVKTKIETVYHFYYEGNPSQGDSSAEYVLGWMPDGYTLIDIFELPNEKWYTYADENSSWTLTFLYSADSSDADIFLLNADCAEKEVMVNGMLATLYIPFNDDSPAIVWEDREKGVLFFITAQVSEDVLIKMAENIVEKKQLKNFSTRCPKSTDFIVTKGEHTKEGGESHEKGINPLGTVAADGSLHNGAGKPCSYPFN